MFRAYLLEDPENNQTVRLDASAYLLGALLGPVYVGYKTSSVRLCIAAIAWTALHGALLVAVEAVTSFIPAFEQAIALGAAALLVLIVQSHRMVGLIRTDYRRKGYEVYRD